MVSPSFRRWIPFASGTWYFRSMSIVTACDLRRLCHSEMGQGRVALSRLDLAFLAWERTKQSSY